MLDLEYYFSNAYNDRIVKELGKKFEAFTFTDLAGLLAIVSQACGFARSDVKATLHMYTAAAYLKKSLVISEQVDKAVEVLDRFPVEDSINLLHLIASAMANQQYKFNLERVS